MNNSVAVAVFWPDADWISAHPGGPKRWLSFFIFAMQAFGADELILIGGPEIGHGYDIKYTQYDTIEEVIKEYSNYQIVLLDGEGSIPLHEYEHPKGEALYIVGNDYGGIPPIIGFDKVRIESVNEFQNLWSHNCISIVLYDRSLKLGSSN